MRINRLDLIAFGPFTDLSLAFEGSERDLHLVYGPNEAGKSSALRGIFGWLFGIHPRSSDNFLHDNKAMRVGGELRNQAGETLRFVRRKGRKNDLMVPDTNAPLPASSLEPFVGAWNAETFERVWGIDHRRLIEGGAELQSLKGLTGESLFAAALGIRNLSQVVTGLDRDGQAIFVADRRASTTMRSIRKRFDEASKQRREAEFSASAWTKIQKDLKRARESEEQTRERLRSLRAESNRLERVLTILEDIGERQSLQRELESMQDVSLLPADYSVEERRKAQDASISLGKQLDEARQDLDGPEGLAPRRRALEVDDAVLDQAAAIERLVKRSGAYQKACSDLPKRESERRVLAEQAARLLEEMEPGLDAGDADKVRVKKVLEGEIVRLGRAEGRLRQDLEGKTQQLEGLHREIEQDRQALDAMPAPRDVRSLRRALDQSVKQGDLSQLVAAKSEEARGLENQARAAIERLGHWRGEVGDLPRVQLPLRTTVDEYADRFRRLADERERDDEAFRDQQQELARLDQEIESAQRTRRVPPRSRLAELRARRDAGWQLVRRAWLDGAPPEDEVVRFAGGAPLDQAYEVSVREADETADRIVDESELSASLEQKRLQCEALRDSIEAGRQRLEAWQPKHASLTAEWESLWTDRGVTDPLSPREMAQWLEGLHDARSLVLQAQEKAREAAGYEASIAEHTRRLAACLAEHQDGVEAADRFDELVARAQQIVEDHAERERERKSLSRKIADQDQRLAELRDKVREAREKLDQWGRDWASAMRELGCAETVSVEQANDRLQLTRAYFEKRDAIEDLDTKRIRPMQDDKIRFEQDARDLVERCAGDLKDLDPALVADTLAKRLKEAEGAARDAKNLDEQIDEKRKQVVRLQRDLSTETQRLERLCALAGVDDAGALMDVEAASDRKNALLVRVAEIDRRLIREGEGASVDALIEENAGKSSDDLKASLNDVQTNIETLEAERDDRIREINDLQRQAGEVDGEARAAWADQQALGCVAEAAEQAERYVRLRLASHLLRQRIEEHRAANQDPMMVRASELFATITCGSFVGLTLDYDEKEQPRIVGVRDEAGTRLGVEAFSRGAADQLYLALRLAYLQARLEGGEPMPMILDDILVDFDDDRASAALQVLADMASKTQIILLTHHQHLRELACRTLGRESFHEHVLDGVAATG